MENGKETGNEQFEVGTTDINKPWLEKSYVQTQSSGKSSTIRVPIYLIAKKYRCVVLNLEVDRSWSAVTTLATLGKSIILCCEGNFESGLQTHPAHSFS